MSDPSTISYVINEFWKYKIENYPLKFNQIQNVMSTLICLHAPLNHGSEVAWAVWTQIVLDLPITGVAAKAANKMSDPIVAILLLDANTKNLINTPIDFAQYQQSMTEHDLYGDQWVLSYESNVKNWPPSTGSTDHVAADKCFSFLKLNSVSFYDDNWLTKNNPKNMIKRKPHFPGGGGTGGGVY